MTKDELRKHCERMCARYAEANRVTTCLTYEEHKLVLNLLDTDDVLTKESVLKALEDVRAEIDTEYKKFRNKSDKWDERANGIGTALEIIDRKIAEVSGKDCRDCKKWNDCECGKKGHDNGTSIGYSAGECSEYEEKGDKA